MFIVQYYEQYKSYAYVYFIKMIKDFSAKRRVPQPEGGHF